MRLSIVVSLAALAAPLLLACASSAPVTTAEVAETGHDHHDHHDRRSMDHHFKAPEELAAVWNTAERDAWQKPDEIVAALDLTPGATVADLGAGTGYLTKSLRAAVGAEGRVIALDVEPAMIAFLEQRRAEAGWDNVEVRRSTHEDPTLAPTSVTAMVTLNTWHHVADRTAFAKRIHAALEEGGRFVVVDFIPEPTDGFGPPVEMRLAPEAVVAELEAAGFTATIIEETLMRHYIVVATRGS